MRNLRSQILVVCVLAGFYLSGAHSFFLNEIVAARQTLTPRIASGKAVIVAIDAHSLDRIGIWPWPRDLYAGLISRLEDAHVQSIAFDVDFSSPSNAKSDARFAAALAAANLPVILPTFEQPEGHGKRHINKPIKALADASWPALVNVSPDRDGVLRRYPISNVLRHEHIPSMAVQLAGSPAKGAQPFWIDYSIAAESIPVFSFADVLDGKESILRQLKNKIAIIGGTAIELGDRFTVPTGKVISGPIIQALAAESILQNRVLQTLPEWTALVPVLLLMSAMIWWHRRPTWQRMIFILATALVVETGGAALQKLAPDIFDTTPLLLVALTFLIVTGLEEIDFRGMLSKVADRRFERIAMSLGEGLVCCNDAGLITVWNRGASAIFGYRREEMLGRPVGNIMMLPNNEPFCIQTACTDGSQSQSCPVLELEGLRKDGARIPIEAGLSRWAGPDGQQYGAVLRDISVRKRETDKIRYLAEFDNLTGLANRHALTEYLSKQLLDADAREMALVLFDLDSFKEINDTLGHISGDEVLYEIATRLQTLLPGEGLVGRLGGDEFAVILTGDDVARRANAFCEAMLSSLNDDPVTLEDRAIFVKGSLGVAFFPQQAKTTQQLFANADLALYQAKIRGKNRYLLFDQTFRAEFESRLALETELKRAVSDNEFELFFQPQVALVDERLVGAEALVRWRHPARGLIPPSEFLSTLNSAPFADEFGAWVLRTACRQAADWYRQGHKIRIGVNLSPSQLKSPDLVKLVAEVLDSSGLPPSLLELEVTEDVALADHDHAAFVFTQIRALGAHIAFDDFGTGYASLSSLTNFPLDVVKLDKSFVLGLTRSQQNRAIVKAMISLSGQLGLRVIAEGVEDQPTADLLAEFGCKEVQGYLYGRPIPAAEFKECFLIRRVSALPQQAASAA